MNTSTVMPLGGSLDHAPMRRQNWVFYLFVILIPLQNIYLGYFPNPGKGLNFINMMFAASLLMAVRWRGGLVRGSGVKG